MKSQTSLRYIIRPSGSERLFIPKNYFLLKYKIQINSCQSSTNTSPPGNRVYKVSLVVSGLLLHAST